ncbi:leucine-rich repeat-containing protein 14-like [Hyperolius riggenbachi]|uniref:leucine-rich repeat-containing protein 14-like n=1 Tax=Hyperolius riggenbachi TaxID=752182 RepID=UPI0035A2FA75
MTGIPDDGLKQGPDTMSLWARTVSLAKACIDISKRHCCEATQAAKRRRSHAERTQEAGVSGNSAYVEVRVDIFVNSTSYSVLREALMVSSYGPLRLQCRDLRAEELSLRSTMALLKLLRPMAVRQVDLRFNNLGLEGLNVLLPYMSKFSSLQSVKLPYSNIDIRRLSPQMEEAMKKFSSLIGQLTSLKELNLGSSRLSGRLAQLLGGLQQPLESLELAFCYLLPADCVYLSRSIHVSSLKKLDFSGNNLSELLLSPFQELLTTISSSLLHLDIMECKLCDSALSTLVPALCRCFRLRYLGLSDNPLSSQGLKTLLHKCLHLQDLQMVVYPFPVDCYINDLPDWPANDPFMDPQKVAQISTELEEMLVKAQRTDTVWTTDMHLHRSLDYLNLQQ